MQNLKLWVFAFFAASLVFQADFAQAKWRGYVSVASGSLGGVKGANNTCNGTYSGAHACSYDEIIKLGNAYPYSQDAWVINGSYHLYIDHLAVFDLVARDGYNAWSVNATPKANCSGWTASSWYGPMLDTTGHIQITWCNVTTNYLPCCS